MSTIELVRRARTTKNAGLLAELSPYSEFLGISAEVVGGELLGKLSYTDGLIGDAGVPALHGGAIGGLLESTAIFQILWEAEVESLPKLITITIDYLRSGRARDTFATGIVTKHGRHIANVRVEAWQDDRSRPIAAAHAAFLLRPTAGPIGG